MCPTDQSRRTLTYWEHDPNNDENRENWGRPFPGDSDDEDDDDGDYEDNGEDDDGVDDEEGKEGEEGEEEEWEEYEEQDKNGVVQKRRRRVYRGPRPPRDETYRDNGEEDDLSQADSNELVPESSDEGSTTSQKRKRDGEGSAQRGDKTQERQPKRPKVTGEQTAGEGEDA